MGNTAAKDARKVLHAERRQRIAQLRIKGWSWVAIGREIGISTSRACEEFRKGVQEIPAEVEEECRALELMRLDGLQREAHRLTVSREPDIKAKGIDCEVKICARRAKFLGLDAPVNLAHAHSIVEKDRTQVLEIIGRRCDPETARLILADLAGELSGPQAGLPPGGRHPEGEAGPADGGGEPAGSL